MDNLNLAGESSAIAVDLPPAVERLTSPWKVVWRLQKWHNLDLHEIDGIDPDEVLDIQNNLLLSSGGVELLKLLTGTGGTAYSSGNAYLKVGNSSTAASAGQTDMQGGSTDQVACSAGYPTISGVSGTWRFAFGASAANFAWEEWGIKNGSGAVSSSVIMLNRKVANQGTKNGGTWTIDCTLVVG